MRTNIEIDDDLMREAQAVAGTTTKRETVDYALRELVRRRRQKGILDLVGKIEFVDDPLAGREGRTFE